ncbi:MAG: alanine--tRNA ligase [Anaerolineae bacterium]|nr:alanine--tRNA ligase [Anaerolineae bacterium]MCX8068351.1 alanine--tRNA ligase [Anaerolineae bacterium]MDW7991689.1 alanine--tRNA ligase [Anaerolineae bacterium]
MKKWTSDEVRQSFLDFFAERGHTIVPSASLVPHDDPSLLFTNAGMNQFKDVFLGIGTRPYKRAADTQKCLRVSGKHADLEDVGRDTYHHTFFEMLGNWSFGDYYKKEAIAWAWELLTKVWGLPKERLWATCFEDDLGDLPRDDEAAHYWRTETDIDPSHILFFGRKDNFWEMGDTGPCGPCSEIHYDRGPEFCSKKDDPTHVCGVNQDCGRFLEIWNLVFIQYNRKEDGTLEPLPAKHVDTGAGLERIVAILQGVDSNYKTDLFTPIMDRVQQLLGHTDEEREKHIVGYRVIADHARAVTFLIGDGVLPGNEGRGYVLRMILRRAVRFGRKIGFTQPFMDEVAKVVIDRMSHVFPELEKRREFILTTIRQEERRFLKTLDAGLARLDEVIAEVKKRGETVIPGREAFRLYDTFGLALEIVKDVAEEHGLTVDEEGFHVAMEEQRARARAAEMFEEIDEESLRVYRDLMDAIQKKGLLGPEGVEYDPYTTTEVETKVVGILRDGKSVQSARPGDKVEVVLAKTCFYVESGGQVSDTGAIAAFADEAAEEVIWEIEVSDVRRPIPGLIVHVGEVVEGTPRVGDSAWALVDYERRMDIARNHTATHLLHRELRNLLGEHVAQAGSLVAPDRLRFDFTHPNILTQDEIDRVVRAVNEAILANYPVTWEYMSYREALEQDVIALFEEKYGDTVRVLTIGWPDEPYSRELCGGTHVEQTADIGSFYIVSEQGIGAGVRRIEAVTGRGAVEWVQRQLRSLEGTAAHLLCAPEEVNRKVLEVLDELQSAKKEIARLQRHLARYQFERLLERVQEIGGIPVLAARVDVPDMDMLREITDWYRDRVKSGVVVLGTVLEGRPSFVAAVTPDLVGRGLDAVRLVRGVAEVVGGGGGGRPTMAQAGGKDARRLEEALRRVPQLVREALEEG